MDEKSIKMIVNKLKKNLVIPLIILLYIYTYNYLMDIYKRNPYNIIVFSLVILYWMTLAVWIIAFIVYLFINIYNCEEHYGLYSLIVMFISVFTGIISGFIIKYMSINLMLEVIIIVTSIVLCIGSLMIIIDKSYGVDHFW